MMIRMRGRWRCRLACLQQQQYVICNFLLNKAYNMLLVVPLITVFLLFIKHKTQKFSSLQDNKKIFDV